MRTVTVNLSLQERLLAQSDAEAKRESRSRSELLREAARQYVQRQRRWDRLFALGDSVARRRNVTQADVSKEIRRVRGQRRAK